MIVWGMKQMDARDFGLQRCDAVGLKAIVTPHIGAGLQRLGKIDGMDGVSKPLQAQSGFTRPG